MDLHRGECVAIILLLPVRAFNLRISPLLAAHNRRQGSLCGAVLSLHIVSRNLWRNVRVSRANGQRGGVESNRSVRDGFGFGSDCVLRGFAIFCALCVALDHECSSFQMCQTVAER